MQTPPIPGLPAASVGTVSVGTASVGTASVGTSQHPDAATSDVATGSPSGPAAPGSSSDVKAWTHEEAEAWMQASRLSYFLSRLTTTDGRTDGGQLRLLFQQLTPAQRPTALQALEPYRQHRREMLRNLIETSPTANVDELRRDVARLNEIGTDYDAVADPAPDPRASITHFGEFMTLVRVASSSPGVEDELRQLLINMTPNDRSNAAGTLAAFRVAESRRIDELRQANGGHVDPSEYDALRRLAEVDAPITTAELPEPDRWPMLRLPIITDEVLSALADQAQRLR